MGSSDKQRDPRRATDALGAEPPQRSGPRVQMKRSLAGLPYEQQAAMLRPSSPLQMRQDSASGLTGLGAGRIVQRKPDASAYTTVKTGALGGELQACLALAQANATSAPSPLPDWILTGTRPTDGQAYNSKEKKQFAYKWGRTFGNNAGTLPGVAGAGGYNEYYAQPGSGATDVWGKNRIVRQTNDPDGNHYWWATSDHYTSVAWIEDA